MSNTPERGDREQAAEERRTEDAVICSLEMCPEDSMRERRSRLAADH